MPARARPLPPAPLQLEAGPQPPKRPLRGVVIRKRERGVYAVSAIVPVSETAAEARTIGEVRRHGRLWRHLLAPEREWLRMRDCAADLLEQYEHPEQETAPHVWAADEPDPGP